MKILTNTINGYSESKVFKNASNSASKFLYFSPVAGPLNYV